MDQKLSEMILAKIERVGDTLSGTTTLHVQELGLWVAKARRQEAEIVRLKREKDRLMEEIHRHVEELDEFPPRRQK